MKYFFVLASFFVLQTSLFASEIDHCLNISRALAQMGIREGEANRLQAGVMWTTIAPDRNLSLFLQPDLVTYHTSRPIPPGPHIAITHSDPTRIISFWDIPAQSRGRGIALRNGSFMIGLTNSLGSSLTVYDEVGTKTQELKFDSELISFVDLNGKTKGGALTKTKLVFFDLISEKNSALSVSKTVNLTEGDFQLERSLDDESFILVDRTTGGMVLFSKDGDILKSWNASEHSQP